MNERIKELTAQLGEPSSWGRERPIGPDISGSRWYGWSDHQQELLGYNTPLYDTAQLKKFAELIVRECTNFLKDTMDDHFAAEQLEEHLGVEE
jgi:hypothetical protein